MSTVTHIRDHGPNPISSFPAGTIVKDMRGSIMVTTGCDHRKPAHVDGVKVIAVRIEDGSFVLADLNATALPVNEHISIRNR